MQALLGAPLTAGVMHCVLELESTQRFACAGTSAGRGRARCIYAASVVANAPLVEALDSTNASGSFSETTLPEGFYSASLGHRAKANNVVPAQTGLGQPLSVASESSQVNAIPR